MGFSSVDDWINKVTNSGQFFRSDWTKITTGLFVAGRWYDFSIFPGTPPLNVYGELTYNPGPVGSKWGWTGIGSGGWSYTANTFVHIAGTDGNLSQPSMAITSGRYYQVTFTLVWTSGTSITPSINGTNGTARSTSTTHTEVIGPVGASGGLVFTPTTNAQCTVTNVSVIETAVGGIPMSFVMNDSIPSGALYSGGSVTPKTKHVINAGLISTVATGVPGVFMLCDFLLAYPLISAASSASQTLTTTNVLSRYTDGVGVRAFIVATTALGATAMSPVVISYTNQAGASGQAMPYSNVVSNNPVSSVAGTIIHSAAAVNCYGPFLPLAAGDTGMRSVQSIQFGSSSGTAGTTCALVLVKPLFSIPITTAGLLAERDLFNQLPSLPQIQDGSFLGWLYYAGNVTVANTPFYGYIDSCYG